MYLTLKYMTTLIQKIKEQKVGKEGRYLNTEEIQFITANLEDNAFRAQTIIELRKIIIKNPKVIYELRDRINMSYCSM